MPSIAPTGPKPQLHQTTQAESEEILACSPAHGALGFVRFCEKHVLIKDKATGRPIPFKLWPGQRDLAELLVSGRWVLILKARQLGITWLVSVYCFWRMYYTPYYTAVVVNQGLVWAEEFVGDKTKFIYDHLPPYFRHPIYHDTKTRLQFGTGGKGSHDSMLRAVAGSEHSARSITGNLCIFDEAAYIENFRQTLRAAEPTLANTGGQTVVLSSSNGPVGLFYELCTTAMEKGPTEGVETHFKDAMVYRGRGKYTMVFLPWNAHPDRTQVWYDQERVDHREDPDYMRREFPRTPEEAFEASGGRVYPMFRRRYHVRQVELKRNWPMFRGIDWGENIGAFVCLWACEIPSAEPKLTVDPSCIHTIREMLAYSYKEDAPDDVPEKRDDHCPDALRYLVATFNLTQWVHVYREFYISRATARGYTAQTLIAGVKERSGWELTDRARNYWRPMAGVEHYEGTVYDRAKPMLENELLAYDIEGMGHMRPGDEPMPRSEEVRAGIVLLNKLVVGALPNEAWGFDGDRREKPPRPDAFVGAGIRVSHTIGDILERGKKSRAKRAKQKRRGTVGYSAGRF